MDQLMPWFKDITASPFLTGGSFLLAVLGIVLAVVFYFKSRRARKPYFTKRSFNIISDFSSKLSDLQIIYGDEPVKNLTITKIAFWNGGNETIRYDDIAEANPIRVCANGAIKILNAEIIHRTHADNLMKLSEIEGNASIKLSFDFLDKNQGGVIQIVHTGTSSEDLAVDGTIKGVGKPVLSRSAGMGLVQIMPYFFTKRLGIKPRLTGYLFFAALLLSAAVGVCMIFLSSSDKEREAAWVFFLAYATLLVPAYLLLVKRRLPKDLDMIDDSL